MGYFSGDKPPRGSRTSERYTAGRRNTRGRSLVVIIAIARFGVFNYPMWTTTPRRIYDRCRSAGMTTGGQPSPVTTRRWWSAVGRSQQPRSTHGIPSDDPRTDGGGGGDTIGMYGEAPTIA